MRLSTPLGLLGLIGVLLLILIYVLKPKYQDRSISSTYIWKLSLKYKKPRLPFQWLTSSLLVILQFLILGLLVLNLTTPLVSVNAQSGEKIIILDASANMQAESDGRTRFERAVQEIGALADSTTPDYRFTVILAGKEASFVARRLDSAKYIKQLLSELSPTFENANIDAAVKLTEGVLAENPDAEIILFTGNHYSETGAIQVRNMSDNEWNVSILDFSAELENGYYSFQADVASYNQDENIVVSLYIDDQYRDVKSVDAISNEEVTVTFDDLNILNYSKAKVVVDYEDDFPYDNSFTICGWENEMFNVQLVSDNPRFLQSALLTLGNYKIDVPVAPDQDSDIPIQYEGYDLYIFDEIEPEYMPADGTVWFINPTSIPGDDELTLGPTLSGDYTLSAPQNMDETQQKILSMITPSNITLSSYQFVDHTDSYTDVLMNGNDPVILAKDIDGQNVVLFTFSLHNSNLPIIPDYILLMYNLSKYSVKNMIEQTIYEPGDTINISKKGLALSATISSADEEIQYDSFPINMIAEKPGEYTITQHMVSGQDANVSFFVRIDKKQSDFAYNFGVLSDPIIPNNTTSTNTNPGTIDIVTYITGVLLLLMLIEWGLQYNEHN